MAETNLFWKRIEQRETQVAQAHDGPSSRATSSLVVQIPQTGERLVMERGFTPQTMPAQVRVSYVSAPAFTWCEAGVWVAGLVAVLLFRVAVHKLKPFIEVGIVMAFLGLDVVLDLVSPVLANDLIVAGLTGLVGLATVRFIRRTGLVQRFATAKEQ